MKKIKLNNFYISNANKLVLIAGPCVIESRDLILFTAEKILKISKKFDMPFVFKSSYKKANRTSKDSFSGIGDDKALKILAEVKSEFSVPVITDVHTNTEVDAAAEVVDIIQIPAFLCRQTELLQVAGKTNKIINIKKGQFLAPYDMKYAAEKILDTNNDKVLLTERGTTFGYNNLVVDMRGIVIMKELGFPVIMDATHSVQIPGAGGYSGGERKFILPLAKAAVSLGIAGLFLETHPDPSNALSDAASQLPLDELSDLLKIITKIDALVKNKRK